MRLTVVFVGLVSLSACLGVVGPVGGPVAANDGGVERDAGRDGGQAEADAGTVTGGDAGALGDGGASDCSNPDGLPSKIWFVNRFTDRQLLVTWTDESCNAVTVATLEPQSYLGENTNSGDRFQVKDLMLGQILWNGAAETTTAIKTFPTNDTQVCSSISEVPEKVTFRNRFTDQALSLVWVDPACKEHPAGDLAARTSIDVNTYVADVFRFRAKVTGGVVLDVAPLASTNTAVGVPSDATAPKCSDYAATASTVTFQNNSTKTVTLYWVDYQCKEVSLGDIAAGGSIVENTFVSHVFVLRDPANNNAVVLAPPAISGEVVTIPVP